MDYHLNRQGQNFGVFSLDELRRRRTAGELSGEDLVWRQGMANWVPLDSVLGGATLSGAQPPPIPAAARKPKSNRLVPWVVAAAAVAFVAGATFLGMFVVRIVKTVQQVQQAQANSGNATEVASKVVTVSSTSRTEKDIAPKRRQFRVRQWVEGYQNNGPHTASWDREAAQLMESWVASNYGGATNLPSPQVLGDKLAADPACADALVLTAAAVHAVELHEKIKRFERALGAFDQSKYKAYPKFFATVSLARELGRQPGRVSTLDQSARGYFKQAFADGSFRPEDEEEIAELLVNGWADEFFKRNGAPTCEIVREAKAYPWLAQVLEGEHEINEAWRVRGSGWANTVSSQGWQGFSDHLAKAEAALTQAWKSHPERPFSAARMITVAMGAAGIPEMRTWFDRAVEAQIDYPQAWHNMRWGLRPRWGGSIEAMVAFGARAIDTKRFDTDVPRKFFDSVSDVESELELPYGRHIYGRSDIWPHLQAMYEGYVAEPSQWQPGWRSTYAAVAFLAGKYDIARRQLESINWNPVRENLTAWGTDLSLMPLKVAALTGSSAEQINRAESAYNRGNLSTASKTYGELIASKDTDERTGQFSRSRLAAIQQEQLLAKGEWIELMPADDKDSNWALNGDKIRRLSDGALEVESGLLGHGFYSRTRVGPEFEISGEFELVRSSTHDFQAGLLMGLPDSMQSRWYAFRMKRNADEGEVASFSRGFSTRQVARPATVSENRNTFRFRLKGGKADAWVNGAQVLQQAAPEKNLSLGRDCFLGLGAYADMNETVIRYRNVKARRINGVETTTSAESP